MFGPIQQVVFDFDGTLVDTMPAVIRGLGGAIEKTLGRAIPEPELIQSFGAAPQDVLRKWVPEDRLAEAFGYWLESERSGGPEDCRPFDGAGEMLQGLKTAGIGIGIFTGRDRAGTLRIARLQGWLGEYFTEVEMVCGDDGHRTKPNPDALVALIARKQWNPATTLMVGDHPHDAAAGRAAGAKTAAALWDLPEGRGTRRSRFKAGWNRWDGVDCDLRLATPLTLLNWLRT